MVGEGQVAVIHFTGRIAEGEDAGTVFDTTDVDVALREGVYHGHRDYRPLEFRVGEGEVVDAVDDAVREMAVGESRTVRAEPGEAFGPRRAERVVEVPRSAVDGEAEPGTLVGSDAGEVGWVTGVSGDAVEVDFNHELAGRAVEFEIRLLDARDAGADG